MRNSVPRGSISEVSHLIFASNQLHHDRSAQWGKKSTVLPLLNWVALLVIGLALCTGAVAQTGQFGWSQSPLSALTPGSLPPIAADASGNLYVFGGGGVGSYELLKETPSNGSSTVVATGLIQPTGIAVDGSGNVYIADYTDSTCDYPVVYMETLSNGSYTLSTVVTESEYSSILALAADSSGNVYLAYIDGTTGIDGTAGYGYLVKETPSGGSYSSTTVDSVKGASKKDSWGSGWVALAVDQSGNVYLSFDSSVFKETLSSGSYTRSDFVPIDASGIAVDASGNVYLASPNNGTVYIETLSGGSYTQSILASGLTSPGGLAIDGSGNLYVITDSYASETIVELTPPVENFGSVNVGSASVSSIPLTFDFTVGGSIGAPVVLTQGAPQLDFADAGTGTCTTNGTTYTYSASASCTVNVTFTPKFAGVRQGAVEIVDGSGNILATAYLNGIGSGPQVNFLPGAESVITSAPTMNPQGVALDGSGNVYIADYKNDVVLKVTPAGVQSTVASATNGLGKPETVAVDGSGNVYIGDSGNSQILKETPSASGYVTTIVATAGLSSSGGVAVDGYGNVYIADTDNNRVLEETLSAGSYTQSTIPTSTLNLPFGVAVDGSGNVYIADFGNNRVLMETLSGGTYTESTIGSGLSEPTGVALDGIGNVYIADYSNNRVLKETLSGGSYTQSVVQTSSLTNPFGVAVDGSGNIYLSDVGNARVLKEDLTDAPSLSFASTTVGATSSDSPQMLMVENSGNSALTFSVPASGWNPGLSNNFTSSSASNCPEVSASSSPATLAANSSCIFELSFTPGTAGSISGALVLTDNALNVSGSTQSVQLSGTGLVVTTTITWTAPSPITYGTPLSATQLDAIASTLGNLVYTPALGTVLPAGKQSLSVAFTPNDTTDYTSANGGVSLTVNQAPLTATASNASMAAGAALPNLTGTLNGVVSGDGITVNFTTTATSSSPIGTYLIKPVLIDPNGKLANYAVTLTNGTLTIGQSATITTVQTSAPAVLLQNSVTLMAKVASPTNTPAGSVTFLDGNTPLGTTTLDGTGSATLTLSTLAMGSHSITAAYAGNVNFAGSTSSAMTETVEDFSLAASGASVLSITVMPGNTASYTLQLAPVGGSTFVGAVALTLTGLPAGATYTVTPPVIAAGSGITTVTVTVNTAKTSASLSSPKGGIGFPKPLVLALFLPLLGTRKLRRALRLQMKTSALMLVVLGVLMVTGMTACGSGSGFFAQAPQTYPMTMTGTSGALHHSLTLDLTVQ